MFNLAKREGIKPAALAAVQFISENETVKGGLDKIQGGLGKVKDLWTFSRRIAGASFSAKKLDEAFEDACINSELSTARLLIKMGADVNKKSFGRYPIVRAIQTRDNELVKLLLDAGVRLDLPEFMKESSFEYGENPLAAAFLYASPEIADLLLKAGAPIHPLHLITACRKPEYVQLCLDKGIDPNDPVFKERDGDLVREAFYYKNEEGLKLLLKAGLKLEEKHASHLTNISNLTNNWSYHDYQVKNSKISSNEIAQLKEEKAAQERITRLLLDSGIKLSDLGKIPENATINLLSYSWIVLNRLLKMGILTPDEQTEVKKLQSELIKAQKELEKKEKINPDNASG